jgi:tetratricopeptide (TPR) repeat protein
VSNLDGEITEALRLHQSGRIDEALAIYSRLLPASGGDAKLLYLLGTAYVQLGNSEAGVRYLDRSILLFAENALAHNNRGNGLRQLARLDDALASYDRAIALKPGNVYAHFNRGNTLLDLKRLDEALASFDETIALKPDFAEAHNNRCTILFGLKRFDLALAGCDQAIALNPNYADAYYNRGNVLQALGRWDEAVASYNRAIVLKPECDEALYNKGVALQSLARLDDALACYDQAIALNPDHAEAYVNRGSILRALRRPNEAVACYERAIALTPMRPEAYFNYASLLRELMRLPGSLSSYDKAIELNPNYAEAYSNRGNVFQLLGRLGEAIASYDKAVTLKPAYAEAYANKSWALLMAGDFCNGWNLYEWRWRAHESCLGRYLDTPRPIWEGKAVGMLLVWAEQGVGDEIFFASMLTEARARVGSLTVSVDPRLLPLMKRSFADIHFVEKGSPPPPEDYDAHLPMGSLGRFFRNTPEDFARVPSPYLKADVDRAKVLRSMLLRDAQENDAKLIGISWRSANAETGTRRSMSLKQLASALKAGHSEVKLLSLQYGDVSEEIAQLKAESGIEVMQCADVDNYRQLDDFAALVSACDRVVSVQNSTVHMAGALGVPVWVLLPFSPDWRWQLEREDSLWYPTARVFRQRQIGDWGNVLAEVTAAQRGPIGVAVSGGVDCGVNGGRTG